VNRPYQDGPAVVVILLLQQRSDEGAFFRQKWLGSEKARVVSGAFFVTVGRQNRCAHCERARRLAARYARLPDCSQRLLIPAQPETGQAECCPGLPVLRFFSDEHLSFPLRCFRRGIGSAEQ
jgi:hypothetical protein